ncbi:CHL1 helicase, partial [Pseudohyphozyma bogoriensis]
IVTLPYNMLMSKSAREALGISLKDHVVVIDEAHNLIQTLLDMHSVTITSSILSSLRGALVTYFTKFKNRFKGSNAQYLRQLLLVLKALSAFVDEWGAKGEKEKMMSVNEVVKEMKGSVDQVNMIKLDRYLKESHIARKIGGYLDLLEEEKTPAGRQAARSNATRNLHRIQAFLVSLTNATGDGRILLNAERVPSASGTGGPTRVEVTMKYMLLAPSESFREVAEEARSVVLAGGTMAPMSDFKEQLFPYLPIERFSTFSCGHIVAPDRVTTVAVAKGPTGIKLNFTFDNRKDEKLIDEMGLAILNISTVVPKGVVVFVPSKDFLAQIQTRWEKSGFLEKLGKRKKIFWEPKERVDVDPTLREYAAANKGDQHGAILFAVVDAKLSEGINFADDMARAVIIVGIPYPSRHSTEIKERMAYLNSQPRSSTLPKGKDPGMVLYQNMAFRGVNQSIGRAIRHQFDWAAIVLLDERYTMPNNQAQLPAWLGSDVKSPPTFGGVMKESLASHEPPAEDENPFESLFDSPTLSQGSSGSTPESDSLTSSRFAEMSLGDNAQTPAEHTLKKMKAEAEEAKKVYKDKMAKMEAFAAKKEVLDPKRAIVWTTVERVWDADASEIGGGGKETEVQIRGVLNQIETLFSNDVIKAKRACKSFVYCWEPKIVENRSEAEAWNPVKVLGAFVTTK